MTIIRTLLLCASVLAISGCTTSASLQYFNGGYYMVGDKSCVRATPMSSTRIMCIDKKGSQTGWRDAYTPSQIQAYRQNAYEQQLYMQQLNQSMQQNVVQSQQTQQQAYQNLSNTQQFTQQFLQQVQSGGLTPRPGGITYRVNGNTIFGSDGSTYRVVGNTIFSQSGATCTVVNNVIVCR